MSTKPSRRDRQSAAVEASAQRAMSDRRWDRLRTRGARRLLVALFLLALVGVLAAYVLAGDIVGLLAVLVALVLWLALRASVRTVADLPDEVLDERQVMLRDSAYLSAYRLLAGFVTLLGTVGLLVFIANDTDDAWTVTLTWSAVMGVFWVVLGLALALPSITLALDDSID